jgi:hypothetical protein
MQHHNGPHARPRSRSTSSSDDTSNIRGDGNNVSVEMEDLVSSERREWRTSNEEATLRHRTNLRNPVLDEVRFLLDSRRRFPG